MGVLATTAPDTPEWKGTEAVVELFDNLASPLNSLERAMPAGPVDLLFIKFFKSKEFKFEFNFVRPAIRLFKLFLSILWVLESKFKFFIPRNNEYKLLSFFENCSSQISELKLHCLVKISISFLLIGDIISFLNKLLTDHFGISFFLMLK